MTWEDISKASTGKKLVSCSFGGVWRHLEGHIFEIIAKLVNSQSLMPFRKFEHMHIIIF